MANASEMLLIPDKDELVLEHFLGSPMVGRAVILHTESFREVCNLLVSIPIEPELSKTLKIW